MCSSVYQRALVANTQGIVRLRQKRYSEALQLFYSGLDWLQRSLQNGSMVHNSSHGHQLYNTSKMHEDRKLLQSICSIVISEDPLFDLQDDVFILFNRALHLSDTTVAGMKDQHTLVQCLSSLLTFNVGLTYHVAGLQRKCSQLLYKALESYSIVYSFTTPIGRSIPSHDRFCFIILAVVTNIGHIHAYFRQLQEATLCSDELCMRLVADPLSASIISDYQTSHEEYRIFFMNAYFFGGSRLLPASPAA